MNYLIVILAICALVYYIYNSSSNTQEQTGGNKETFTVESGGGFKNHTKHKKHEFPGATPKKRGSPF